MTPTIAPDPAPALPRQRLLPWHPARHCTQPAPSLKQALLPWPEILFQPPAPRLHCTHPSPGMPGHAGPPVRQAFGLWDNSLSPLHPSALEYSTPCAGRQGCPGQPPFSLLHPPLHSQAMGTPDGRLSRGLELPSHPPHSGPAGTGHCPWDKFPFPLAGRLAVRINTRRIQTDSLVLSPFWK